jgi:hypothetical protein
MPVPKNWFSHVNRFRSELSWAQGASCRTLHAIQEDGPGGEGKRPEDGPVY